MREQVHCEGDIEEFVDGLSAEQEFAVRNLQFRYENCQKDLERYVGWGPYEDYLCGTDRGWASRIEHDSFESFWLEMESCDLDFNHVADFYFGLVKIAYHCTACDGSCYGPEAKAISDGFYAFDGGQRWRESLTQDEVDRLWEEKRLWNFTGNAPPTAEAVNQMAKDSPGMHDGINRWIVTEQRLKRLGLWEDRHCKSCDGEGVVNKGPTQLTLSLWLLHPRTGASRGVFVKSMKPDDLPKFRAWLMKHKHQHDKKFAWVTNDRFHILDSQG